MLPNAQAPPASPRSKLELLYRDVLQESALLITRIEEVTGRQEQIQQALHTLPAAIRQAGIEAATQAADQASRALQDTNRTLAKCERDLRIATRAATRVVPAAAWRIGILCVAGAFIGGALGAAIVALLISA